jgi:thiosulfate/3-mercaptopyruvate sulfurtransferase
MTSALISAAELAERLGEPGLRVLDASWHLDGRDARAGFEVAHIPGALFFDLDASSDQYSPYPHMLPPPGVFTERMEDLGIGAGNKVVVYDTAGLFSAARVWWMLTTMGLSDVRVLDGGLPAWRAAGGAIDSGRAQRPRPGDFKARRDDRRIADRIAVRDALAGGFQVVDARGAARFRGETPEPRPGLLSGHMPGALNLPYADVLDADGLMKRGAALADAFRAAGVDIDRPVITTCGSGVTAAILTLALAELGRPSRLYDASWAEWGSVNGGPVATGPTSSWNND